MTEEKTRDEIVAEVVGKAGWGAFFGFPEFTSEFNPFEIPGWDLA